MKAARLISLYFPEHRRENFSAFQSASFVTCSNQFPEREIAKAANFHCRWEVLVRVATVKFLRENFTVGEIIASSFGITNYSALLSSRNRFVLQPRLIALCPAVIFFIYFPLFLIPRETNLLNPETERERERERGIERERERERERKRKKGTYNFLLSRRIVLLSSFKS